MENLKKESVISPEKMTEEERLISVEIEKKIIGKYIPSLMIKGKSKIEAQTEWIRLYAEKYRKIFDSNEKAVILEMYHQENGLEKAADYIEKQLEAVNA